MCGITLRMHTSTRAAAGHLVFDVIGCNRSSYNRSPNNASRVLAIRHRCVRLCLVVLDRSAIRGVTRTDLFGRGLRDRGLWVCLEGGGRTALARRGRYCSVKGRMK